MHDDSGVKKAAAEYEVLKIIMHGLSDYDHDLPEDLLDRQSLLVGRLSLSAASSGTELAYKAYVLRDLLVADDMIGTLTMSLCHDTERLFPTAPVFSTGYLRDQMALSDLHVVSLPRRSHETCAAVYQLKPSSSVSRPPYAPQHVAAPRPPGCGSALLLFLGAARGYMSGPSAAGSSRQAWRTWQ